MPKNNDRNWKIIKKEFIMRVHNKENKKIPVNLEWSMIRHVILRGRDPITKTYYSTVRDIA